MLSVSFNKIVNKRLELIFDVLYKKGKEYSTNNDRLHNFKRAAELEKCIPEKALLGMWTKHLVSLFDMIEYIEIEETLGKLREQKITKEMLEEKIGDSINYLILLEALIKERYGWV